MSKTAKAAAKVYNMSKERKERVQTLQAKAAGDGLTDVEFVELAVSTLTHAEYKANEKSPAPGIHPAWGLKSADGKSFNDLFTEYFDLGKEEGKKRAMAATKAAHEEGVAVIGSMAKSAGKPLMRRPLMYAPQDLEAYIGTWDQAKEDKPKAPSPNPMFG